MTVGRGEMKGLSLRNYPAVLADLRGDDVAARMYVGLSVGLRDALETGKILANCWYPVEWKCEMHRAGREASGDPLLARKMGHEMTKRDVHGIYRAFMRVMSPAAILIASSRIFSTYLRPGTMQLVERNETAARVQFDGCIGFDGNMWQDVIGGCQATLEATGARLVRMRTESGGRDGDVGCVVRAWWSNVSADEPPPMGGRGG
jgi:hypothetical protein